MSRSSKPVPPGIPSDLADDGTPFTVVSSTTYKKIRGESPMDTPDKSTLTEEDFEDQEWLIYEQTRTGWEFIGECDGRPYDPDLKKEYGDGKYKIIPMDAEGKPVDKFGDIRQIGNPLDRHKEKEPDPKKPVDPEKARRDWQDAEMPAWMRLQLQQASEERNEARRRQEEGSIRQEEWERQQAQREWDRQQRLERQEKERLERDERERRDKMEREDRDRDGKEGRDREERQWRAEQLNAIMTNAAGVMTAFIESRNQPVDNRRDINDQMLQALLIQRESRGDNSLKDQIEILALLDGLRESKKEEKEEEGGDIMKILAGAAPILGALRGGGQAPQPSQMRPPEEPPQLTPPNGGPAPADIAAAVLSDPQAVSDAALRDPDGVAQAVMQAVKSNPILEAAVIKALDSD